MSCPDFEALSAFADGESPAAERASIDRHLSDCAACRRTVESIAAERRALSGMAVPPMPADLKSSLEAMIPESEPAWRAHLRILFSPRFAVAAAAACVALLLWTWRAGVFAPRLELPAEFLAAAHNQYALSLRLAPSEKIMTEMPAQLSAGIPGGRDVY